jgi:hypothetical protein
VWERRRDRDDEEAAMAGTHEDAMLVVELAKWGTMIGLSDATRTVFADDFDAATAETNDPAIQPLFYFFETVGTLVKNGLLDRELVYDWLWVSGSWARLSDAARRAREKAGVPALYENSEALAAGQQT